MSPEAPGPIDYGDAIAGKQYDGGILAMITKQIGLALRGILVLLAIVLAIGAYWGRGQYVNHTRKADRSAHYVAKQFLVDALYNSNFPKVVAAEGRRKSTLPKLVCNGKAGHATVPTADFIATSFQFYCSEDVLLYIETSETAAYVTSAHLGGSCIQIGNTNVGARALSAKCNAFSSDWSGTLKSEVLLGELSKAREIE